MPTNAIHSLTVAQHSLNNEFYIIEDNQIHSNSRKWSCQLQCDESNNLKLLPS